MVIADKLGIISDISRDVFIQNYRILFLIYWTIFIWIKQSLAPVFTYSVLAGYHAPPPPMEN
jgi:hypothetical protein